jgi:WD40 repeat protein
MPITIHKQFHLSAHSGSIYALCAKDESSFFSAGSEGIVIEWSLSDTTKANIIARLSSQVFCLYYLENLNHLLCACMDGSVHVINTANQKLIHSFNIKADSVFDIAYMPLQKQLLFATKLGVLAIYNENYEFVEYLNISDSSLRNITHIDENLLAICASDFLIHLLDFNNKRVLIKIEGPNHSVFTLAISNNRKYLISGSRDACVYTYEIAKDFELKEKIQAHLFTINNIIMHDSEPIFFTASRDKHIKVWDSENFKLLKVIDKEKYDGHVNSVNKLLWMKNDNLLISASDDKSLMGWKVTIANS